MSFGVNLYQFGKRQNSTARPTLDTTVSEHFEVDIKEPFSIINPELVFEFEAGYNPTIYNYAYIAQWERRYRILDWKNERGLWVASCDIDVLATWREAIGETPLYVLRASNEYDGWVSDGMYPATPKCHMVYTPCGQKFVSNLQQGTYVLGIIGGVSNYSTGVVTYYAMTQQQYQRFCYHMLNIGYTDVTSIEDNLLKSIFNPLQYVASCQWFPFTVTNSGTSVNTIPFGWWEDGIQDSSPLGERLFTSQSSFLTKDWFDEVSLQASPYASRGQYMSFAPYTKMWLDYQPFGIIPLDPSTVNADGTGKLMLWLSVDLMSGIGDLRICAGSNNAIIDEVKAKVSFDVPLAQISTNVAGALGSAVGAVGSVMSGNFLGAGVGVLSAIEQAFVPHVGQVGGYSGAVSQYQSDPLLVQQFYQTADEDNEHNGRPLCKVRRPADLGGYMVVECGDVPAPATGPELERIKSYLESGFYYE